MSSECHCLLEYWLYFILVYICFLNYILKLQKVKQKYLKTPAVCLFGTYTMLYSNHSRAGNIKIPRTYNNGSNEKALLT